MDKPTIGSLFAGIGGFDLGFERAGFKTVWQVEIDPYCQKVLAKNFPEAQRFGDIRECGAHNLVSVDVITGGFPCQDISNAGLRAGITGERSGLWTEMRRIVGELRPRFILVENVAALLGRGMGTVLGDLAEIGYDAEWRIISAAEMGAPHLRERIWILAYPFGIRRSRPQAFWHAYNDAEWNFEARKQGRRSIAGKVIAGREEMAYADCKRPNEAREFRCDESSKWIASRSAEMGHATGIGSNGPWEDWQGRQGEPRGSGGEYGGPWATEPQVGRVVNGLSPRVDELRGLGNAVVPQIPEMYARAIRGLL